MVAGRPPKPTHLKVLEGNPGKRPLPVNEPQPMKGLPEPPADLSGEARAEWDRVAPELARMGVLSLIDRAALLVYCNAWSAYTVAVETLRTAGPVLKGKDGQLVKNPAAQLVRDQADLMLKYGSRFGLNPSDRARLSVEPDDNPDLDIMRIISPPEEAYRNGR